MSRAKHQRNSELSNFSAYIALTTHKLATCECNSTLHCLYTNHIHSTLLKKQQIITKSAVFREVCIIRLLRGFLNSYQYLKYPVITEQIEHRLSHSIQQLNSIRKSGLVKVMCLVFSQHQGESVYNLDALLRVHDRTVRHLRLQSEQFYCIFLLYT